MHPTRIGMACTSLLWAVVNFFQSAPLAWNLLRLISYVATDWKTLSRSQLWVFFRKSWREAGRAHNKCQSPFVSHWDWFQSCICGALRCALNQGFKSTRWALASSCCGFLSTLSQKPVGFFHSQWLTPFEQRPVSQLLTTAGGWYSAGDWNIVIVETRAAELKR